MILTDKVDVRYIEKEVNQGFEFKEIILIQNSDNLDELSGILNLGNNIGIYLESGNMSFNSTHGGMLVLRSFRNWINSKKIVNVNIVFLNKEEFRKVSNDKYFDYIMFENISTINVEKFKEIEIIKTRFRDWADNKEKWI
jgi:hypothetical protein